MGKSSRGGVFGLIRGSVGPATYSVGKTVEGKKQQVIREKPTEVANPRTRAQAIQRMKLAPIFFMRALLSTIVDHSWKGVANGNPSLYEFMSRAMKEFDVPYLTKGSADKAIGGYVISDGDIANLMLSLAVSGNTYSPFYKQFLPVSTALSLKGVYENSAKSIVTWADLSAALLAANPFLQDGDEIATLTFIHTVAGGQHGVKLVKVRGLIDTKFTTETPDAFKKTLGSGENQTVIDGNVAYALSLWNSGLDVQSWFNEFGGYLQRATSGAATFVAFFGLTAAEDDGSAVAVVGAQIGSNNTGTNLVIPQIASEVIDGVLAGAAVIVSRKDENGNWQFTKSDICLTKGYFELFNSDIRLEAAIKSYMSEDGSVGSLSDRFLHLTETDSDVAMAALNITFVPTGGSATNVTIIGAVGIGEESGTRYIFTRTVENVEYVVDAPNGNILTATVGEDTVQVTWRMVTSTAEFIDENDVQYI